MNNNELEQLEDAQDAERYRQEFPQRKAEILDRVQDLKKLLDRDPPPTYSEVWEAIDRINHPNDRRI